jgi:hypothetical protein
MTSPENSERIALADVPRDGAHTVPSDLYWEARCRRAEVEAARLRLELTLRAIEQTNTLIRFGDHRYRWDDEAETVTRVG